MKTETKIKIIMASIVAIIILLLLASFILGMSISKTKYIINNPKDDIIINAGNGATLWAIAEEYKPNGWDVRDFITVLKEYNNFGPYEELWAGQLLRIPQFEEFNPMYN